MLENSDSSVINSGDTEEEPGGRNIFQGRKGFVSFLGIIFHMEYEKKYPEASI
ncbi:MAG TPA: hypothetical protein VJ461_02895 [Candidatus Nanoarchaeia archaeon]|nr:hypothetical protein [Candidatus Nanoarchaeia archaeon]